ncbi:MAG: hypothetical protein HY921_04410 [Elusimicrobia bacterium]|nr:hypothetical protein [Elusimicrobiota bacterium]
MAARLLRHQFVVAAVLMLSLMVNFVQAAENPPTDQVSLGNLKLAKEGIDAAPPLPEMTDIKQSVDKLKSALQNIQERTEMLNKHLEMAKKIFDALDRPANRIDCVSRKHNAPLGEIVCDDDVTSKQPAARQVMFAEKALVLIGNSLGRVRGELSGFEEPEYCQNQNGSSVLKPIVAIRNAFYDPTLKNRLSFSYAEWNVGRLAGNEGIFERAAKRWKTSFMDSKLIPKQKEAWTKRKDMLSANISRLGQIGSFCRTYLDAVKAVRGRFEALEQENGILVQMVGYYRTGKADGEYQVSDRSGLSPFSAPQKKDATLQGLARDFQDKRAKVKDMLAQELPSYALSPKNAGEPLFLAPPPLDKPEAPKLEEIYKTEFSCDKKWSPDTLGFTDQYGRDFVLSVREGQDQKGWLRKPEKGRYSGRNWPDRPVGSNLTQTTIFPDVEYKLKGCQ